jgi:hypothetical protein
MKYKFGIGEMKEIEGVTGEGRDRSNRTTK